MTPRPAPRTIVVDGAEMIALTPAEYEDLARARRQTGSHLTRLNILKQQRRDAERVLVAVADLLGPHAAEHDPAGPAPGCLPCAVRAEIARWRADP
jgi:hypothetical protein